MPLLNRIPLRQFPELDTIRFISILLVVLHHQFFESNPLLKWFNDHGWVGVDIFFCMSGFLITGLLLKEINKDGTINLKLFWFRRMLRLWPSWLVTLFLSFVMVFILSSSNSTVREALYEKWWHYLLHVGNYSYIFEGKIHTLYSHYWSLAVEEHFYFLWPVILIFFTTKKSLFGVVWSLIIASFMFRYYHIMNGGSEHLVSFSTHTRLDQLLMGCLLAFYFPTIKKLSYSSEIVMTVTMFSLYFFGLYICKNNQDFIILNSLSYTVIGFATCLLIIIALKGNAWGLRKLLNLSIFAKLGVLSYGVYLIHLHVNYIVFPIAKNLPWLDNQNILALINLILPFVPAYFMYFYIDEFFSTYKKKLASESSNMPKKNITLSLSCEE